MRVCACVSVGGICRWSMRVCACVSVVEYVGVGGVCVCACVGVGGICGCGWNMWVRVE